MGLPAESKSKPSQPLIGLRGDPLKHFTREKPWWKLAALLVDRIPMILYGAAAVAAAVLPFLFKK